MAALPDDVVQLFWDVDPDSVDLQRHGDYVMERVMTRGTWAAMQWLRSTYSKDALGDFVLRKGQRILPPRELAFWCLVSGLDVESRAGGGRPLWAGQ